MFNLIMNTVKWIFFAIDSIIYLLIELFFNLFFEISSSNFLNSGQIADFSKRIYLFIGIFMLFKISISLINSIVNPDLLNDKQKGVGKIITRVLIALSLLVLTPIIFEKAKDLQMAVVREQIIAKAILTVPGTNPTYNPDTVGQGMANTTFAAFFNPNNDPIKGCKEYDGNNTEATPDKPAPIKDRLEVWKKITWECESKDTEQGKVSSYNYQFLISTAAGLLMAWIILNYCLEIAIRVVKLGFLQLMAPIPIMTYIDPESSKSGAFNNWIKACTTVYLDLFIRLIIIFFVVYVFQLLFPTNGVPVINVEKVVNGQVTEVPAGPLAQVAIIIGLLMFAQQAPKLIKDLFGIKDSAWSGNMGLNSIAKAPGLNRVAGFATGAAGGALSGFRTGGLAGMGAGLLAGGMRGQGQVASSKKLGGIFGKQKQAVYQKNTGTNDNAGWFGGGSWVEKFQKNQANLGVESYKNKLKSTPEYIAREQAREESINRVDGEYKLNMEKLDKNLTLAADIKTQSESNANINYRNQIEQRTKDSVNEGIKNGSLLTDGKPDSEKVNNLMQQIRSEEDTKFEKEIQNINSQYEASINSINLEKQNLTNSLDSQKSQALENVDKLHSEASKIDDKLSKVETAKQQAASKKALEELMKDFGYEQKK